MVKGSQQDGERGSGRRRRSNSKRKPNKKLVNFLLEVRWLLAAILVGLPILALAVYIMER